MHTWIGRANAFSTTTIMTMLGLAAAIALTSFVPTDEPSVHMAVASIVKFLPTQERCDRATLKLDLDLDLTNQWQWNVAHIYVSILAKYTTKQFETNEVVLWDTVISKKERAKITKRAQMNKYALKDYSHGLRGANVTLMMRYQVFPFVGPLMDVTARETYDFVLPVEYIK